MKFPFLDGDVLRSTAYGVYISQLIRFVVMLRNLIIVIKFCQQNFSNKDIDIIRIAKRFQNLMGGILTKCLNIMSKRKK